MPLKRDGRVTVGTVRNLLQGLRSKPMQQVAIDAALEQAAAFSEKLITVYSAEIAAGEVGESGSARASDAPIESDQPPTVLLYGLVQSGKTAAMILTSALCLDNGFRIIVVLTADNVALVQQTANRFKALDGPRVFSSNKDDTYEWEGQEDELAEDIATDGLVLVCAKDAFHLPRIIKFLQEIEAPSYPAIILDDEADAATPDTTVAARASGRANAPQFPSTIHRRVIENVRPGEEGESFGEVFPHSLYVQVTATPYLLFLQRDTSRTRPTVPILLEPGEGYCGGERFFGGFDPQAAVPNVPIVLVPDNEGAALNRRNVPIGLAASIDFFVLAAVAKALADGWPAEGYKHLSHPSHLINQHVVVAAHIEKHIRELRAALREGGASIRDRLSIAYAQLQRSANNLPSLDQLAEVLPEAIRQTEYIKVNSDTDVPQYGPRLNFLIGGNILGRGLTIDDLLVTYYVREAQVSQMDTVWQHARMYGYRESLMPYTRVYLPRRLATRFKEIHLAEVELRALIRKMSQGEEVPIRVARGTRPTRPNAVEGANIRVIRAGIAQIFPHNIVEEIAYAEKVREILLRNNVPIGLDDRDSRTTAVPLETIFDLVDAIPITPDDPGRWTPASINALIESYRDEYNGTGYVYVRRLQVITDRTRGRLSGPEIDVIRTAAKNLPALALLYVGETDAPRGWQPTLVLPPGSPSYILNPP